MPGSSTFPPMPGSSTYPLPRDEFSRVFLHRLAPKLADPHERYCKVTPTLVLMPDPQGSHGSGSALSVTSNLRTVLKTKAGVSFDEALSSCDGKALLLNFCNFANRLL